MQRDGLGGPTLREVHSTRTSTPWRPPRCSEALPFRQGVLLQRGGLEGPTLREVHSF